LLSPSAPALAQIRATVVASGRTAPLGFVQDPSDPCTQYIVQQGGRIRVLSNGVMAGPDWTIEG
jgi:hypothetical protein